MAFRFQKRIKIAPGVRVNLGLGGASISAGPRGSSVTVGKNGVYGNAGIPGTGLSYRRKINRSSRNSISNNSGNTDYEYDFSDLQFNLKENGSINIETRDGGILSRRELQLFWKQESDTVQKWLEQRAININGDIHLLSDIHIDTPAPNTPKEYKIRALKQPKPTKPASIPPLSFFKKLFKANRDKHHEAQLKLESDYQKKLKAWNKANEAHKQNEIARKLYFNVNISTDLELMTETLQIAFNDLLWPRETLVSYEISNKGKTVWLDIDLPEIEDLPQKVASLAASKRKLNIKSKAQKQLREEYARHIHGIIFRLTGVVFATLPSPLEVIVSGYSQRLDKSTGKINDDYLFTFKIDRGKFSDIDFNSLDNVDPIEALTVFEHRRKMTATGIFKAIEPFEF